MDQDFTEAVGAVIREEVAHGNEVEFGGLGTFRLEHRNQYQEQFDDGRVVMVPPRDKLVFSAEKMLTHEN